MLCYENFALISDDCKKCLKSFIQIMVHQNIEQILNECGKSKNKKDYFQKKPTPWTQAGWFLNEFMARTLVYVRFAR